MAFSTPDAAWIPHPAFAGSSRAASDNKRLAKAVLKHAIDGASRTETEAEAPVSAFRGKAAALLSAEWSAMGPNDSG